MAVILSHSHFLHVAFASILAFQTFDRIMFDIGIPDIGRYAVGMLVA